MPVGIDFDNTIVKYDHVFAEAARARGWVASDFRGSKKALRDAVRLLPDGEIKWQILQGEVYGRRMGEAEPFPGVIEFIAAARRRGIEMFIVSHKTRYSNYDEHKTDLRAAAMAWMESNGFFDAARLGFSSRQVVFADTRAEKIAQISALGCGLFIDDLEEVFADPAFPTHVKRVLFTPDDAPPAGGDIIVHRSWPDIARLVLDDDGATNAALEQALMTGGRLAGTALRSVEPARHSGNNRLFRATTADGHSYALKYYPRQATDPRDRLATEFRVLEFMRRHDISQVPRAIAKDDAAGFALYEWIEGGPVRPSQAAIDAAVALIRTLHELTASADAAAIPPASEACLSAQSIVDQVRNRLAALRAQAPRHTELGEFLGREFEPIMEHAVAQAREIYRRSGIGFDLPLDPKLRCLSPSDFGFHNALGQPDGRIVFLDFEYFGWDDPVKLASDFVLHPGMDLTAELKGRFLTAVSGIFRTDQAFATRLRASLRLYALRWTMILLNEYLPERWARRVMAGAGDDRATIMNRQLAKARIMVKRAQAETIAA
jgi:hypothetical protein